MFAVAVVAIRRKLRFLNNLVSIDQIRTANRTFDRLNLLFLLRAFVLELFIILFI